MPVGDDAPRWLQITAAVWSLGGLVLIVPSLIAMLVHWKRMRGAESPEAALAAALGPKWNRRYWRGFWVFLVGIVLLAVALNV